MFLKQLTLKLLETKDSYLSRWDFPEKIVPPGETKGGFLGFGAQNIFWDQIEQLRKFTDSGSEHFSDKHEGSTGWEYEMMMAFVNKQFFYSRPTTIQNYTQVSSSHSLKVETEKSGAAVIDRIKINGKAVGTIRYSEESDIKKRNQAIQNNEYKVGFVCHFHTHPKIQSTKSPKPYYTFFSPQDIHSLMNTRTPILGLVTDRLWLVGKTRESIEYATSSGYMPELGNDLATVSRAEKLSKEEFLAAAGIFFDKYKLAGYSCEFGGTPKQITASY